MQAVDFDEDGDLDLVMGKGYFERVLDELEERTGEQNPLQAFPGQVERIADLDGDGRLDVLVAARNSAEKRWRYFRRTAAGTFVESWENPLAEMQPSKYSYDITDTLTDTTCSPVEIHVADWNSDGLSDVLFVGFCDVRSYYQHVVDRDLRRNSHFKMYEDIQLSRRSSFVVQDWNEDGFEDVMVVEGGKYGNGWTLRRYEFQPGHMKEVLGLSGTLNLNNFGFGTFLGVSFNNWLCVGRLGPRWSVGPPHCFGI